MNMYHLVNEYSLLDIILFIPAVVEKPPPPLNCMNIVVKIEKPEIILVEDQLNPDCNCLVLNVSINLILTNCLVLNVSINLILTVTV